MSHRFLPWLRAERPAAGAALEFRVGAQQRAVPVAALGPGDVERLAPGLRLMPDPAPNSSGFPSSCLASVRFADAAFPWLFTPLLPDAAGLLMPWLALVVIGEDEVAGALSQRPGGVLALRIAITRLPAAAELGAFAHVQLSGEFASTADTLALLREQPSRAFARLLAAQRLAPAQRYRACLVPSFEAGRRAGLGEAVSDPGASTPAWSGDSGEVILPVYRHWSFGTAADADIETVVRRLATRSAAAWPEAPALDLAALQLDQTTDYRGVLRPLAAEPAPASEAAAARLRSLLPEPGAAPSVTLPWWAEGFGAPRDGWARALNLDPRLRAMAGLGAELVRARQDRLVDAFWRQAGAVQRAQRLVIGAELAAAVGVRLVRKHLAKADPETVIQALRPAVSAQGRPVLFAPGVVRQAANAAPAALRRIGAARRLGGAVRSRVVLRPALLQLNAIDTPLAAADPLFTMFSHAAPAGSPTPVSDVPIAPPQPVVVGSFAVAALDTVLDDITQRAKLPARIDTGGFAPGGETGSLRGGTALDEPLVPALAEHGAELVFPLIDAVPDDSLQLLAVDGAAVEALLVGANTELVRELQWRGAPVRTDATLLPNAWVRLPHPPIDAWEPQAGLGTHAPHLAATVIVMNSPLLSRLPGLTPWLAQAVPAGSGRRPGPTTLEPLFMHALSETVAYFGFALTADALAGRDGSAGWYFCFAQGPQQPRFGLDETPVEPMHSWADLDWSRVNIDGGRLHLTPAPQPLQPGGLAFGADGAQMAAILLQRSIRFAIHGSQLPGLGAN